MTSLQKVGRSGWNQKIEEEDFPIMMRKRGATLQRRTSSQVDIQATPAVYWNCAPHGV